MTFTFSERHIDEFMTDGYTVLRAVLPTSLITDLRRECQRGREQARQQHGQQVQRFQPVAAFDLDMTPFTAFRELPELVDAFQRLFGPRHTYGDPKLLGCLLEPGDLPYCTHWHRDWRDNAGVAPAVFETVQADLNYFNQINCPLYEDHCTWVVPGSQHRRDTAAEIARFPTRPIPGPELDGKSAAERERLCLDYCRSMPGARQLCLDAGDLAVYRSTLWHIGNYLPYKPRATLHDAIMTPEFQAWWDSFLSPASQN